MMWLEALQRLIASQCKIRVWREYRGLTQTALAKQIGVSQSRIALLESGKSVGTLDLFKQLAEALNLELDDLI